jgi:3-oxoacyl-[acyl-carrier-protein] synthase-3
MRATILGTGSYVPAMSVANEDFSQFPASALKLIELKTGIRTRRYAAADESTSDLAIKAARNCLEKTGFEAAHLDAIILATSSPDRIQPATATRVQHELGAEQAFAFDINSVCSGAVYGIYLADAMIRARTCERVLLVASEVYSRLLNRDDFSTYPYFGDGAGAVLFGASDDDAHGVVDSVLKTDGSGADAVQVPAGGTMMSALDLANRRDAFFQMDGKGVYAFATRRAPEIACELLQKTGIDKDRITFVVTHQANLNIIKEIASRTGIPFEKFVVNLDRYGNTAAASILLGLDDLFESGRVADGDLIMTIGFGGGLSWGANLITASRS